MPLFGPPEVIKLQARGQVDSLIRALNYRADPTVRADAAKALGALRAAAAVEPLLACLRDASYTVRGRPLPPWAPSATCAAWRA